MNTLKAEKRTMDTKAKRLRREGYVTGNVFGREMEGSLPVKIEKSAVEKLLKTNNLSLIHISEPTRRRGRTDQRDPVQSVKRTGG